LAQHGKYTKKFYLKAVHSCDLTDTTFKQNPKIIDSLENSINVWFSTTSEPYEVILWVNPEVVAYFERKPIVKNQKLYKKSDGSAEMVLKITNEEEIYPILKFWIPTLRVIEPVWIQEKFTEMLTQYLKGE
jgi:predicted DNA-binding transcriptional regulator YafY